MIPVPASGRPLGGGLPRVVHPAPPPARSYRTLAVLLVGAFVLLAIGSMQHMTLTPDEAGHYDYGVRLLLGAPVVQDTKMPVSALNALPRALARLVPPGPVQEVLKRVETGRYVTVAIATLWALVVLRWSSQLYGPGAGLLSLTLYVFDPNILAHARLVTNDVYTAGIILCTFYCFWCYLRVGGWQWGAATAVVLGISLLVKYTCLFLFPLLALVALGWAAPDLWRLARRGALRAIGRRVLAFAVTALVFLLVALLVINFGLLFRDTLTPLRDSRFESPGLRSIRGALPQLRVPVPALYLQGLDTLMLVEQAGREHQRSYLLGKLDDGHQGFRGYFLYASLYKVPIATQLLILAAVLAYVAQRRRFDFRRNEWLLLCPVLFFVVTFNTLSRINIGIRYFLPVFPLLYVFCGSLLHSPPRPPRWASRSIAILLGYLVVSVLSYYPHFIPYFNELVWDRRQAYRVLADSNLDWRQNGWYVEQWLKQHPEAIVNPERPVAGTIVVRVNALVGTSQPERYRWLRENFEPVEHIAYAHLVFHVTTEDLERIGIDDDGARSLPGDRHMITPRVR
jgi:4-amino-4-deoxy-L-arabinose transferase-like glycosyltransferase